TVLKDAMQLVLYLLLGFAFVGKAGLAFNFPALIVIAGLSLVLALAFGVFAAALQLTLQKGGAVVWFFGSVVWLFSGTMFPVGALPAPLQALSKMIPLTYALDGLRAALLKGTSLAEMGPRLAYLAPLAVILLPLAIAVFSVT